MYRDLMENLLMLLDRCEAMLNQGERESGISRADLLEEIADMREELSREAPDRGDGINLAGSNNQ